MNKHEQQYCVTRKELLAVITALKHFHIYLYGREVLLRTDNAAVSWMKNLKNPTGQAARWLQEIETYNLKIIHRAGNRHQNADALSRRPCKSCDHQEKLNQDSAENSDKSIETHEPEPEENANLSSRADWDSRQSEQSKGGNSPELHQVELCKCLEEEANRDTIAETVGAVTTRSKTQSDMKLNQCLLSGWMPIKIRQEQLADPNIGPIMVEFDSGTRPEWQAVSNKSSTLKTVWRQWDRLQLHGGMLYRKWISSEGNCETLQLIVPLTKQADVLTAYHDIPSAAHLGSDKMVNRIKQCFYWPGLKTSVQEYCNQCDLCTSRKCSKKPPVPLRQHHFGEPMERVAVDIFGPLPETEKGNKYILVICDCFTRWTEAFAMPDQEAETVVEVFVNEFVSRFGTPLQIHSDQGRNFEAKLFQDMCDLLKIDKSRTSPLRPMANGTVERFNRTLAAMLTMYCSKEQRTWDQFLPQVMLAYRASTHTSTGFSPNMMVLGREVVLPMQAVIGQPDDDSDVNDYGTYISNLQQKSKEIHEICRQKLKKAANYQKRHYDLRAKKRSLRTGQAVWLYEPTRKIGICSKLVPKWKGPYVIQKKIDDVTYLVKKSASLPGKVFHVDRLMKYRGSNIPAWMKAVV